MRWSLAVATMGSVATLLLGGLALAEERAGTPAGGLDLSVRARALGVAVEPVPASNLDLETMKAPTGAGTTRLPQPASGREGGVYIGVGVCDPVLGGRYYEVRADDPGTLPEGNLRGTSGPRTLFLPGRP